MKPFEQVVPDPRSLDKTKRGFIEKYRKDPSWAKKFMPDVENLTEEKFSVMLDALIKDEVFGGLSFQNDKYMVTIRKEHALSEGWPRLLHLSIKRIDKQPIHEWRDLQEIKNELVGPEFEAIELYPAESRRVDSANQYHLYVLADEARFPIGYQHRLVENESIGNAVQRPLGEETK